VPLILIGMKRLLIARHAHALEKQHDQSDKLRELSPSRIQEAHRLGAFISQLSNATEKIICSSAKRTEQTASIIARSIDYNTSSILKEESLYMASLGQLINYVADISDEFKTVIIVGHNPTVTLLVQHYCLSFNEVFEPAGLAMLSFEAAAWKKITPKSGTLLQYWVPSKN
jgi:phosphohistidine phosphatase